LGFLESLIIFLLPSLLLTFLFVIFNF